MWWDIKDYWLACCLMPAQICYIFVDKKQTWDRKCKRTCTLKQIWSQTGYVTSILLFISVLNSSLSTFTRTKTLLQSYEEDDKQILSGSSNTTILFCWFSKGGPLSKHVSKTRVCMHHHYTRNAENYTTPKCKTERLLRSFFPSTILPLNNH